MTIEHNLQEKGHITTYNHAHNPINLWNVLEILLEYELIRDFNVGFRFSREEIKRLYRGFKTECPTGILRYEKHLKKSRPQDFLKLLKEIKSWLRPKAFQAKTDDGQWSWVNSWCILVKANEHIQHTDSCAYFQNKGFAIYNILIFKTIIGTTINFQLSSQSFYYVKWGGVPQHLC